MALDLEQERNSVKKNEEEAETIHSDRAENAVRLRNITKIGITCNCYQLCGD